jgi:hypothetical protein
MGARALPAGALTRPSSPLPGLVERLRGVYQEMVDAALAGAGVERIAEVASTHIGHPVAILMPGSGVATVRPKPRSDEALAALERYEATRLEGRPAEVPPGVELLVPISSGGRIVGSAAMLAGDAPVAMEAGEFLHLAALATLTAVALGEARDADDAAGLVEELRSGEMDGQEVIRRAARLGCDLARGAVVIACEVRSERPRQAMALIASEHPGALAELIEGRIYAVLPANGDGGAPETAGAAAGLAERLRGYGPTAVSSFCTDPTGLRRAIQETELVLEVVSHDEGMAEHITGGAGSGVYRLLFRALATHPEEVRSFYEDTVAPVVRYDDQYQTELLKTLEAYLGNDCNMNATARSIYAHRHTVAYRLQRVKDLTGLDPMVNSERERLGLGLKAYRIVAPTLPR